ncbi:MAG TPA: hypothetical protein VHG90_04265, partial [Acidimicrobiales bacterium]|nr:hypothetical protein [Acidimicrobiales bacterium]
ARFLTEVGGNVDWEEAAVEKEAWMAGEQTCPACGMEKSVWKGNGGEGVEKDGQTYCCQECADGTGCICG